MMMMSRSPQKAVGGGGESSVRVWLAACFQSRFTAFRRRRGRAAVTPPSGDSSSRKSCWPTASRSRSRRPTTSAHAASVCSSRVVRTPSDGRPPARTRRCRRRRLGPTKMRRARHRRSGHLPVGRTPLPSRRPPPQHGLGITPCPARDRRAPSPRKAVTRAGLGREWPCPDLTSTDRPPQTSTFSDRCPVQPRSPPGICDQQFRQVGHRVDRQVRQWAGRNHR